MSARIELSVELYGTPVATVHGTTWRSADLQFTGDAMRRWSVNSPVLSVAAPLGPRPRAGHAARRRNVLAELLPEGPMRERLARLAGVDVGDAAALLARFGRDVAGAVQVYDARSPWEPPTPALVPVDEAKMGQLIDELALGNDPRLGKTSLAGVQPKLVLTRNDGSGGSDQWFQPVGGAASSHIVKPAMPGREAELAEEAYGHRLAALLGLAPYSVELTTLAGRCCLVIERYDRSAGERIHQEDFNQALGLSGDQKYQEVGGHARLARVADVVSRHAHTDLPRLATLVTLAVALGNLDLHAKNLALLHPPDGSTTLAPAYDTVPMAHRPGLDGRLAMAVGGEYRIASVGAQHLEREVRSWGADPAIVASTLRVLAEAVGSLTPPTGAEALAPVVARSLDRLLAGDPIGDAFARA